MKVDFFDLSRQYKSIQHRIDEAISETLKNSSFIGGSEVQSFEEEFSDYLKVRHCISCGNGTDALEILLQAIGTGPGDEVIIPSHSWISTVSAVVTLGAIPVFVDTLPLRYTIDPAKIEKAVTLKTKAVIPVHLYGCPAEMDEICAVAKKHHLFVLEDCAQAHGAEYKGKKVGTLASAGAFSFYPTKNLGSYGDAGAIVTNDNEIAERARMISNYGQKEKHLPLINGRNSRMDTLQASILRVKLPFLDEWNFRRRQHAQLYANLLHNSPLQLPNLPHYSQSAVHLFVIQTDQREALAQHLKEREVSTAVHYPAILPAMPLYQEYGDPDNYPVSQKYQKKILSLPMYPELKEEEIYFTGEKIVEFLNKNK